MRTNKTITGLTGIILCFFLLFTVMAGTGCSSELCPGMGNKDNLKSDSKYSSDKNTEQGQIPSPYTEKYRKKIKRSARISWIKAVSLQAE